jgi:hypothetical protein
MLLKPKAATIPWNWATFHDVCVKCRMLMILVARNAQTPTNTHTHKMTNFTNSYDLDAFFFYFSRAHPQTFVSCCRRATMKIKKKRKDVVENSIQNRRRKVFWIFFLIFSAFWCVVEVFSRFLR